MIVVLVLILLLIASIALYLVMLGRLSAIVAEKGYGSLIHRRLALPLQAHAPRS
jgi:hypothetical protein